MNFPPGLKKLFCQAPGKRATPGPVFQLFYPFYRKTLLSHMGAHDGPNHPCNRIGVASEGNG